MHGTDDDCLMPEGQMSVSFWRACDKTAEMTLFRWPFVRELPFETLRLVFKSLPFGVDVLLDESPA